MPLGSKSSFWGPRDPVIGYSHTHGRVGPIFLFHNPHPEESWRRRGAWPASPRSARTHAPWRNSTIAERCHTSQRTRCTRPRPVRRRLRRPAQRQLKVCSSNCSASAPRARGPDARRTTPARLRRRLALREHSSASEASQPPTGRPTDTAPWARARAPNP